MLAAVLDAGNNFTKMFYLHSLSLQTSLFLYPISYGNE
jgi:hypothetical protein